MTSHVPANPIKSNCLQVSLICTVSCGYIDRAYVFDSYIDLVPFTYLTDYVYVCNLVLDAEDTKVERKKEKENKAARKVEEEEDVQKHREEVEGAEES